MFTRLSVVFALAGALFSLSVMPSQADTASDIKALQAAVSTLQGQVKTLQSTVASQQTTINSQQTTINAQKSLLTYFSRKTDTTRTDGSKGTELYLTGCNLHVVNGLSATNGDPNGTGKTQVNGLGNVIIGYNSLRGDGTDARTGSHNLITGDYNNYSSYGGVVFGFENTVSGVYASVSGGQDNTASDGGASVSGGLGNTASGIFSTVSGGFGNAASGSWAGVSGGLSNTASGLASSVSGGQDNTASGNTASISGGDSNAASGSYASVSGGLSNTADGELSSVGGGLSVLETIDYGFAAGGHYSGTSPGPGVFHSP